MVIRRELEAEILENLPQRPSRDGQMESPVDEFVVGPQIDVAEAVVGHPFPSAVSELTLTRSLGGHATAIL